MKCRECGGRCTAKIYKKNYGKCQKCYKVEKKIVKQIEQRWFMVSK
ncbi:hypothetical protein HMPREF0083_01086 [Aneurinibacillus aneurinilyticus ATCC 12856]|uniref:Uncharacterized protein n=1 Tax=Aneurinibacillus aneurinilyticus ATCC 12856 TaxID=649747 RepID=U1X795_ANEAE|nr:hypothetical protein HMPREF0083_01086 [Aneurinibacillus aneurinilyticus ATCC 12856]